MTTDEDAVTPRFETTDQDADTVRELVDATGVFTAAETEVAVETSNRPQ